MANDAHRTDTDTERWEAIRRAIGVVLPDIPEVEAAYVELEGSYVTVRAVVREANLDLASRLNDAALRLDALVPGLSFDVFARSHQGRGPRRAFAGLEPTYERPAA